MKILAIIVGFKGALKSRDLTSRDVTTRHYIARVDIARAIQDGTRLNSTIEQRRP